MGLIPGVCYGSGQKNISIALDYQAFRKVYLTAGENTIIDLEVEGASTPFPVLVHDIQYDSVYGNFNHVDFIFVRMDQEVTTHVSLTFIGVAPAVKELGGVLVTHKSEIAIKCLPKYLIHKVDVDISGLVDFHCAFHVKELVGIPKEVTVLDNPEDVLVTVVPPRAEEEVKPAEEVLSEAVPAEAQPGQSEQSGNE